MNEVGVKITAEVHCSGAKGRGARFYERKIHTEADAENNLLRRSLHPLQLRPPMSCAWNRHAWQQADVEMSTSLPYPLQMSPYPPRCGFYWATESSSQSAPLWLLPARQPAKESAERGMRLHIQQTAHSSQGLNTRRSVRAVGKSGLIFMDLQTVQQLIWGSFVFGGVIQDLSCILEVVYIGSIGVLTVISGL